MHHGPCDCKFRLVQIWQAVVALSGAVKDTVRSLKTEDELPNKYSTVYEMLLAGQFSPPTSTLICIS